MASTVYINGVEAAFALPGGRLQMSESSGEDGPRSTLLLQVDFEDRWNLVQALRGYCVVSGSGYKRVAPWQHPFNPNMVCTAVGEFEYIQAATDESGLVYSNLVRMPAHFSCVPWQFQDGDPGGQNDPSGQAWTVTKIKPSAEVYQPPGGTFYLGPFGNGSPGTPLDESASGFVRANVEIQVTRKFLPYFELAAICQALGDVNSVGIKYGDQYFGATTLLFAAVEESEPYFDSVGNPVLDVTQTFLGKVNGATWNSAQGRDGNYHLVNTKNDGTGSPPFSSSDFTTLPR